MRPGFDAGPISNVVQPFRVEHDYLSRIDIWAYIDGGDPEAWGDVLASVIPHGTQSPIRESRVQIRHPKGAAQATEIRFAPIPASRGQRYTLELRVLSGPAPYVFVGITSSDLIPAGPASINGDDSRAHLDLAMRPYWVGRGGRVLEQLIGDEPWRVLVILDVALWGFVLVSVTTAAWTIPRSSPWRSLVWNAARKGAVITALIGAFALALLLIMSASPRV